LPWEGSPLTKRAVVKSFGGWLTSEKKVAPWGVSTGEGTGRLGAGPPKEMTGVVEAAWETMENPTAPSGTEKESCVPT
jgi:hypothetical protein